MGAVVIDASDDELTDMDESEAHTVSMRGNAEGDEAHCVELERDAEGDEARRAKLERKNTRGQRRAVAGEVECLIARIEETQAELDDELDASGGDKEQCKAVTVRLLRLKEELKTKTAEVARLTLRLEMQRDRVQGEK